MSAISDFISFVDVVLIVAAFATSLISGVIGLGGGTILAALMFVVLPPAQALPLHAFVQVFSNASRTVANFRHVAFGSLFVFTAAAIPATIAIAPLVVKGNPDAIRLAMGIFLLATFDGRWIDRMGLTGKLGLGLAGIIAGGLGSVVGATGAMMAPFFFRAAWRKETIVGTQAVCQGVAHIVKLVAFATLGVNLIADWPLAMAMIFAVIAGTFSGKALLDRVEDRWFRRLYAVTILVLGVQLIVQASIHLSGNG